jgi:hypothetical protein
MLGCIKHKKGFFFSGKEKAFLDPSIGRHLFCISEPFFHFVFVNHGFLEGVSTCGWILYAFYDANVVFTRTLIQGTLSDPRIFGNFLCHFIMNLEIRE